MFCVVKHEERNESSFYLMKKVKKKAAELNDMTHMSGLKLLFFLNFEEKKKSFCGMSEF